MSQAFQFRPSSHKDDFQIGAEGPQVVQGIQGPTEPPAIPPAIAVPFVPLGPTIESPVESPADHSTEIDSEESMVPVSPENVKAASDDYLGGEGGDIQGRHNCLLSFRTNLEHWQKQTNDECNQTMS